MRDEEQAAVVVGGSAGALEALGVLLGRLPPAFQVPLVVVVHLPRRGENALGPTLARICGRAVREPVDKEPLARGAVYLAPADYHLLLERGPRFALTVDEPVRYARPSIDVLFESAADALGERLSGVLLSGANDDGARGLRAIEARGGRVIVQAPEEASCRTMPEAALALCRQPLVLRASAIRVLLFGSADTAPRGET